MCHSALSDRTRAYQVEGEWVHLVYKTVAVWTDSSLRTIIPMSGPRGMFQLRRMLLGVHYGFHTAVSPISAVRALLRVFRCLPGGPDVGYGRMSRSEKVRRYLAEKQGATMPHVQRFDVVRCLVPERCMFPGCSVTVPQGLAMCLYMLPPGKPVHPNDLVEVGRWISKMQAAERPRNVGISIGERLRRIEQSY